MCDEMSTSLAKVTSVVTIPDLILFQVSKGSDPLWRLF